MTVRNGLSSNGNERYRADLFCWLAGILAGDDPATGWSGLAPEQLPAETREQLERLGPLLEGATGGNGVAREAERVRLLETAPGGVPAPPYGSWWLEGRLQGETTLAVAELFRREGMEPSSGPADYLPAELELVQLLLRHQLAACSTGEPELAERARRTEEELLGSHLCQWLPRFCDAARSATEDPFWQAVFDLLETLVRNEQLCIA